MNNLWIIFVAALVPMIVGFIWYNPKVFGNAWMKAANMTDEKVKSGNMPLIFGVSYLLSVFLAFSLYFVVIHQAALISLFAIMPDFAPDGTNEISVQFQNLQEQFKGLHRTFGHGALHGTMSGFLVALPILATNALFERKGFKYIAVNAGYWILTIALMGGVLCAWG